MKLLDGEARHIANPDTFEIPARSERESVPVGGFVKVILDHPTTPERVWAEVVEVFEHDGEKYRAVLRNNPLDPALGEFGDEFRLAPEHIIRIDGAENDE